MNYIEITKENLEKFLKNIREEDKEELKYFYNDNYKEIFFKTVFRNQQNSLMISDKNNNPASLGGIVEFVHKGKKIGQIWLLGTKYQKNSRLFLFKIIQRKIFQYKNDYDILFNFVYKTNFEADRWLKKFGFKFKNLKNENFRLFYFKNRKANH